ncbi:MAG: helix-turn-helix domain-containing protein [Mycoplasma sp.]|nr:helix-turn-helix domain-containing protein [Candidatus Hennigella equi]
MYTLNKNDYKLIKQYKKFKDDEVALYFFEKFKNDLTSLVFGKINRKFSSILFEKGDLIHLVWNSIKKSLIEYKNNQNFNSILIKNCYYSTIKEVKKFINNNELVMNISSSLETYQTTPRTKIDNNTIVRIQTPTKIVLDEIIEVACSLIKEYTKPTIKRVIYLKSIGYSVSEICKKLRISRHYIDNLLKQIQNVVKNYYSLTS